MKAFIKPADLREEIDSYLHRIRHVQGYSPETIRTYTIALNQFAESVRIEKEDDVHLFNIMPLRQAIASQSKKTISKKLSAIRSFKSYLEDKGYVIRLVGDSSIKTPKTLPKPVPTQYIHEAVEKADLEERVLILLLYSCGLRISEMANLALNDIGAEWIRVMGKGSKVRDIPLLPEISELIAKYRQQYAPEKFLFEKERKRLSENSLRYKIEQAFRRIGIKATPHQLRHAYATDLLNNGARILDVKELLGHSSLGTTEIYTKLSTSLKLKNYMASHPLCKENHEDH